MFKKLDKRLIIDYEVLAVSDLRIGGHESTAPGEVDNPVIKNSEGYPIVPGSSLKGVLRTEMEKLLRSIIGEGNVCSPDELCKSKESSRKEECPACLLFGGAEMAGSIRIRDATTNSQKTYIRDGVEIDRRTRKAKDGAYYDIEVVPSGTVFKGEIMIENPDLNGNGYAKLGALLSTIKFFNATSRTLGGAVSRGFGEVLIMPARIREFTPKDYLEGNYDGKEIWKTDKHIQEIKEDLKQGKLNHGELELSFGIEEWKNYLKQMQSKQ